MTAVELEPVDPERVRARMAEVLHNTTHAPPGKLAHPECPLCLAEFSPERIEEDRRRRIDRGLL